MITPTPLRYPGGKSKLSPFLQEVIEINGMVDGSYVEPFAGGAGVAMHLLLNEHVRRVHINDIDPAICAFWRSVRDETERFCKRVLKVPLTVREWRRQKSILDERSGDTFSLGFAAFYLNRTNRSGVLNGGVIGGKQQAGTWKIDARFNRDALIQRIRRIGRYRRRITVSETDAVDLIRGIEKAPRTLVFLDPPYYAKGQHLYANFYKPEDHRLIAAEVSALSTPWVISYDDQPEIRRLYRGFRKTAYSLRYTARDSKAGFECMFFSNNLLLPRGYTRLSVA